MYKQQGDGSQTTLSLSWRFSYYVLPTRVSSLPGGSDCTESSCNAGDPDSIPGSGTFPWRREWLPTMARSYAKAGAICI